MPYSPFHCPPQGVIPAAITDSLLRQRDGCPWIAFAIHFYVIATGCQQQACSRPHRAKRQQCKPYRTCLLYTSVRRPITGRDKNALFLSGQNRRISRSMVHALVKKHLSAAGLDSEKYSSHKLRHTAATLMLQNGVDVKAVQEVLGHEHLNTTEIYTHIDNEALRVAAKANPLSHVKMKGKIEDRCV